MSLHSLFGRHSADLRASHWEKGSFVSRCTICALPMIKLPGLAWQLRAAVG
ncbi:MAG TPA: hypothetical protein VGB04_12895 [Allosphingosinicella sp.]|jgi:hypothetical protein